MTIHVDHPPVITRDRLSDGSECFIASDPALPGCVTYGETEAEVIELFEDAKRLYLRVRGEAAS
jgi:predicted RNase H-like HicB family nuclease